VSMVCGTPLAENNGILTFTTADLLAV